MTVDAEASAVSTEVWQIPVDTEERELSYNSLRCINAWVVLKKDKGPIRL